MRPHQRLIAVYVVLFYAINSFFSMSSSSKMYLDKAFTNCWQYTKYEFSSETISFGT